uniref:DNA topoisomerase n=1 Tax=Angiostrongylus cantonensis TaxID=6313 RepID=A0A0K0DF89_ANGCA
MPLSLGSDEKVTLHLCSLCQRQVAGEDACAVGVVEKPYECVLCFGLLDPDYISEVCFPYITSFVAEAVKVKLKESPYDATACTLALNLPVSQVLREMVIKRSRADLSGILVSVPYKIRNIDAYLPKLREASGLRFALGTDLQLSITFENNEFSDSDTEFLVNNFPDYFEAGRKRKHSDSHPCTKVSEKVVDLMKLKFGACEARFIASGREDMDVRMLGDGRPFAVELRNCHFTNSLRGIGEEEKKKQYVAYCYSTLPISDELLEKVVKQVPIELLQKTPVRVLKRRALLERSRLIHRMETLRLDSHHFLVRHMGTTVLMVAEKPLLADSIAKILSNRTASKRKGRNGVCSVSEYKGHFQGKPAFFKVTSTCGHVMSLDFPTQFNNWECVDPVDLYTAPTKKIESNPKMRMNDFLAFEANGADYLVLWLDCDKEGENICFEPEPYWVLQCMFETSDGACIHPNWKRDRLFDRDVCQFFLDRVKSAGRGVVTDRTTKESRKDRPVALNTVELMRVASNAFGISPSSTMSIAEHLYTQGFISYPRTETTSYPSNFDLIGTLKQQANNSKWRDVVQKVNMARIYDYIVQHFIATLMGPCIFDVTTIMISCGGERFTLTGRFVKDHGFTEVMPWLNVDEELKLPSLQPGDKVTLKNSSLLARETSPPDYLTESELISLMEKHGIGTDASIPVHISTICQRNYVAVESGRRLVPTKLGISLVHGYWRVDKELVLPTMRAEVETQLNLIAQGKADYQAVRDHVLEMFRQKFVYYVKNIAQVDILFEGDAFHHFFYFARRDWKAVLPMWEVQTIHEIGGYKASAAFLSLLSVFRNILFKETYAVPNSKHGVLQPYGDKKCPLDDFDLVYWHLPSSGKFQGSGGKLARSFVFCPFCYNNPPFESMKEGHGCNHCPHPTCPHSYMYVNDLAVFKTFILFVINALRIL